jgi:hypothetical protein
MGGDVDTPSTLRAFNLYEAFALPVESSGTIEDKSESYFL